MLRVSLFLSFLLLLGSMEPACALTSKLALSQLSHSVWRVHEGVLAGTPSALTQTNDGYIWIGTLGGLYRFDGVRLVEFVAPASDEPLRTPRIETLRALRDGSLMIGTSADIERWKDGRLVHFPATRSYAAGATLGIVEAKDRRIWMVRANVTDGGGPLCEVTNERLKCFGKQEGVSFRFISGLLEDPQGNLLIHTDDELQRWNPNTFEIQTIETGIKNVADGIQSFVFDAEGTLLVGSVLTAQGLGLQRLRGNTLERFTLPGFDGGKVAVYQMFVDSQQSLWLGTQSEGIYRIRQGRVEHFRAADGLSGDAISSITEDREGNIWITTYQGVDRFGDIRVASFSSREGLQGDLVNGVVARRDGSIWLSNYHAIDILRNGEISKSLKAGIDFPGAEVTALFEDRNGKMWVGMDRALAIYQDGKFRKITMPDGGETGMIYAMQDDRQGNLWAIARSLKNAYVLRLRDESVEEVIPNARFSVARTAAITADVDRGVWVGTFGGDVARLHDGNVEVVPLQRPTNTGEVTTLVTAPDGTVYGSTRLGVYAVRDGAARRLSTENGLPCDIVWSLVADDQALWLYAQCGLVSISYPELDRWLADPKAKVDVRQIGPFDGVRPAKPARAPATARSADGKLWFANTTELQMFDPADQSTNRLAPPVLIERIVADGRSYAASATFHQLPARTRNVEIDYTALSYVAPEKMRLRYKLEGYDVSWVDAQTRRTAFYTNLKPGHYAFRMTASNNDGVWNPEGAVQSFEILPAYYQTSWFALLCGLAGLVALWFLYLLRIRQRDATLRIRMEARVKEREQIARDLHDTLLQGMQGLIFTFQASTERLKKDEPARGMLEAAIVRADDVLKESREQVTGVRKTSDQGESLADMLVDAANGIAEGTGTIVCAHTQKVERALRKTAREELYRIGVEAVNNAVRHGAPAHIDIVLDFEVAEIVLRVRDDGRGFDPAAAREVASPGHFGLVGMEERAGRIGGVLTISSRPGHGTEVTCSVPAHRAYEGQAARGSTWLRRLLARENADET